MSSAVIAVVGPTASGKSELAVDIAKKFGGEIISADSRQIYKGLDIGTGKISGRWTSENGEKKFLYKGIPHYLVDEINPKKDSSAGEFKKRAEEIIDDIHGRGLMPIVVGGTNFWIDALLQGTILPDVLPNKKLRRALERKTAADLFRMLKKLDPRRAKSIDPKNPRRLIRAIEIAQALGQVPRIKRSPGYRTLWIGINLPMDALKANIKKRAAHMIARGLLAETKSLLAKKIPRKRIRTLGLEYALSLDMLEGKREKKTFTPSLKFRQPQSVPSGTGEHTVLESNVSSPASSRRQKNQSKFSAGFASALAARDLRYVKKQLAWLKKNPDIRWIKTKDDAFDAARTFLE